MKTNKKITKIIACIMIFISFVMVVGIVGLRVYSYSPSPELGDDLDEDTYLDLYPIDMFSKNLNLYCAEHGTPFPTYSEDGTTPIRYKVSESYELEDNDKILEYIINLPELNSEGENTRGDRNVYPNGTGLNYTNTDWKQQLIWWYLSSNSSNEDGVIKFLKDQFSNTWSCNGLDESTVEKIQQYISDAQSYATNVLSTSKVEITNMEIINNTTVRVRLNIPNTTKYQVYIGNSEENANTQFGNLYSYENTPADAKGKYIDIALTNFDTNSSGIYVKIKSYVEKYRAKIWALMNTESQGLIYVKGWTEPEDIGEDIDNVPVSVDVSLQKYIVAVNDEDLTANETELIERKNTYRKNNRNDAAYKEVSFIESSKMKTEYKKNKVVNIEVGDWVTYKIHVYNNSDVEVTQVTVLDKLPWDYVDKYKIYEEGNENEASLEELTNGEIISKTISNMEPWEDTYFYVKAHFNTYTSEVLENKAYIVSANKGAQRIEQGDYRWEDSDYVVMKDYKVSLQKFVYSVNGEEDLLGDARADKQVYGDLNTKSKDDNVKTWDGTKWRNPHTVNSGDWVTYEIRVMNDGDTDVYGFTIKDTVIGEEVGENLGFNKYYWGQYDAEKTGTDIPDNGIVESREVRSEEIKKVTVNGEENEMEYIPAKVEEQVASYASVWITLRVSESNMSLDTLTNRAEIKDNNLINRNNITVTDTTIYDNMDEDYIKTGDITISGTVWKDVATGKGQDTYDGVYNEENDKKLADIKVCLYREGIIDPIAVEYTNAEGKYEFTKTDIQLPEGTLPEGTSEAVKKAVKEAAKFIKAPQVFSGYQYWTIVDNISLQKVRKLAALFDLDANDPINALGSFNPKYSDNSDYSAYEEVGYGKVDKNGYFSYYVVFEYDGITYTSSDVAYCEFGTENDNEYTSNAIENLDTRNEFNEKFKTINNDSGIKYSKENPQVDIPTATHQYNEETMAIKSETEMISLYNSDDLQDKLKHVNLSLRGREPLDFEINSQIDNVKVTVNGISENYTNYKTGITLRESDIASYREDAANPIPENVVEDNTNVDQAIRDGDIENEKWEDTGLGIEVTYKITVTNKTHTSSPGVATKIINYYDTRYDFDEVYAKNDEGTKVKIDDKAIDDGDESGDNYKSKMFTVPEDLENEAYEDGKMEIYLVYKLNEPKDNLSRLLDGTASIPTCNMSEIYEYETKSMNNNDQKTRGLIDIDSAPGNASERPVYLKEASSGKEYSTVQYYFDKVNDPNKDLSTLEYEDDTIISTVTFKSSDDIRTLTGTIFEDLTTVNETTRIKTGNGKLDEGEEGIYGAKVKLVEQVDGGEKVRYTTTTDKNGNYTFTGFLPGNYIIRYHYGDTVNTVQVNENNKKSYNGEDYQSTNNTGKNGGSALNSTTNYWYLFNEVDGISAATDNVNRRKQVSKTVTAYTDDEMKSLIDLRAGNQLSAEAVNKIINDTKMNAITQNILFRVEKPIIENEVVRQRQEFGEYKVTNMNFGIAELPVTTIDLQKYVKTFTITDSTGENTLASYNRDNGQLVIHGDVIAPDPSSSIDVSIEDDKLQGAKLEITYEIVSNINLEKNFDGKEDTVPTITGLVDYINNNLTYNSNLGDNSKYWEVIKYEDLKAIYAEATNRNGEKGTLGTVDGTKYTTIVKAKEDNPILSNENGTASVTITLERVLSSTDSTIEDIITSNVDTFEYGNIIEITTIDYDNTVPGDSSSTTYIPRDRITTTPGYIIIPGEQWDTASSSIIAIHPPTGDSGVNMVYYIMALISLVILTAGVFGVRKFVLSSKK